MAQVSILDRINTPEDLRALPEESLPQLCAELRDYLLTVVSEVGGHLSSSLGAVELTVALHYTLDTPRDQIVWDVGHQAYIHKILTGRKEALRTIRQYGGISGFLKRSESPYDAYGAGHASTSLSAALGLAAARDLKGEKHRVAAVVGDGALTGGLCYEALNNAGTTRRQFLAVLNDNNMSISPNVGAINRYLTNFTSTRLYQTFRSKVRDRLERMPRMGHRLSLLARRIEEAAKTVITPGALFESLGMNYYGPVDGHDVILLVHALKNLRDAEAPTVLHVLTVKGKGYGPAEEQPEGYHGVKPFCREEGIVAPELPGKPAFQDAFGAILCEMARKDSRVVGITAAMPTGTGIVPFAEEFPGRFFDVGIAEEHAVVFAAGLAASGIRPVVAIYSTFLQRAYDQIVHDVATQHLPVIFCMDRSGLAGEDGPTHHGAFDLSYLRHIPGIVVCAPKDGNELRDMMFTALAHEKGPFAIRYPKGNAEPFDEALVPKILPIGKWERLREGKDVLVLAAGSMVQVALKAANGLAKSGLSVEVANARFIKPLDGDYLHEALARFGRVVTVEENAVEGGFGGAVLEWAHGNGALAKFLNIGIPDRFVTHGARAKLLEEVGLTPDAVAAKVAAFARVATLKRAALP